MSMRSENVARRVLVINPNSNPAVSDGIRRAAAGTVCADTELTVVNTTHGPFSIETLEHRAQTIAPLLALVESYRDKGFDACVLGCYDDIALEEIRQRLDIPVVSTVEASIMAASTVSTRFCVVTTVHSALPAINGLLQAYGVQHLASAVAAGIGVDEAAAGAQATEHKLNLAMQAAIEQHGAEAIVLGSGGLAGRAPALAKAFNLPVIDAVLSAINWAEELAKQHGQT